MSSNKTGIEDKSKEEDPEKQKEFKDKFNKWKVDPKVENSFKKSIIESLSKLCNDSNATTEIGSLRDFKDFCKKNKHIACFNCISINCWNKQRASRAANIKRVFNSKCSKKQLTLGEVKAMAQKTDTPKKDEGTSVGATATITTPNPEYDGEVDEVLSNIVEEENPDASFQQNMAEVQVKHNITAEKLQTRFHYWSSDDPEAMKSDKKCIVCHKRNMNWPRYKAHLEIEHSLDIFVDNADYLDLDYVIYAWENWMENETPSPNPRLYDSVNECELSDFDSAYEEDNNDEEPPKLIPLPARPKRSEHSSAESASDSEDGQSDSSSRSRPNKSRQQISKKLKEVSSHVDTLNENIGGFEGKLVGIEDLVNNISQDLDSMRDVHRSGMSTLRNTVEKGSKVFEENVHQVQSEMKQLQKSHTESSNNLEMELKRSQELSKNLNDELRKSQADQKESNEELKKLQ